MGNIYLRIYKGDFYAPQNAHKKMKLKISFIGFYPAQFELES